ncbi:MAG: sigma-70 family RNA polymerase sigma factor [Chloroflexi bacterium]|nr:sigma-70 family RNA polymerase sigma factor [Chloroflexota bacterium]MCI0649287.1 sigma-70 family RNA polymerase sigma factor [Chloroflexota bacterium]MCI0725980.1 sigma-70 family RNA polymerase sigma factor [Chloroflexota bacterium]
MDEVHLIKQAQKGDVTSFNTLVLHYQDAVYNVAYRIMGESGTAADATQEAFISAYKSLGSFRGGNFKAWLMRIVTNACYDELRRRKRRPQASLDEIMESNESAALLVSENSPGPEEHHQRAELVRAVERCLEDLPDEQKTATILCDIEGYDYTEIAAMMSTSLGTVKSRLSRARARLRECLQGVGELLPAEYRLDSVEG